MQVSLHICSLINAFTACLLNRWILLNYQKTAKDPDETVGKHRLICDFTVYTCLIGDWIHMVDFQPFSTRETTFVTTV